MTGSGDLPARIALVTDFGNGPYVGQVRLVLSALAPSLPVIDLINDLVPFRPDLAGALLPGLLRGMPASTLYVCVVDPGVGGARDALIVDVDGTWLVGPDNGLFIPLLRAANAWQAWSVTWRPDQLSASFHGRDLFAPIAAMLSCGDRPAAEPIAPEQLSGWDAPDVTSRVCYVDWYGNLITGLDASGLSPAMQLQVGGHRLGFARTFGEVAEGSAFWYRNAFGLVEIAANRGRAADLLRVRPGDPVSML